MGYFDNEATAVWLQQKWGWFSASEIHALTVKGSTSMFGEGAFTYIKKIARQRMSLFNTEDKLDTYDMRMGKMREGECAAYFKRMIGLAQIEHHGDANPMFQIYRKGSGASPDAVARMSSGQVSFGSEFKNPKAQTHFDYLFSITDQWDLLKIEPRYYGQCQFSMMSFKCDLWHWVSYDQFQLKPRDKMLIIEVKPDKKYQDDLDVRLFKSEKMVKRIIDMRENGHKGKLVLSDLI